MKKNCLQKHKMILPPLKTISQIEKKNWLRRLIMKSKKKSSQMAGLLRITRYAIVIAISFQKKQKKNIPLSLRLIWYSQYKNPSERNEESKERKKNIHKFNKFTTIKSTRFQ